MTKERAENILELIVKQDQILNIDYLLSEDAGVLFRFDNGGSEEIFIQAAKQKILPGQSSRQ